MSSRIKKRFLSFAGFAAMFFGVGLLAFAVHASGNPRTDAKEKTVVVPIAAISGGVLTFVVSRRMLRLGEEEKPENNETEI